MLDENNHTFTGNIQMNSAKDIFVFACGGKIKVRGGDWSVLSDG